MVVESGACHCTRFCGEETVMAEDWGETREHGGERYEGGRRLAVVSNFAKCVERLQTESNRSYSNLNRIERFLSN